MNEDNEEAPDDQRISELIDKSGNDISGPFSGSFLKLGHRQLGRTTVGNCTKSVSFLGSLLSASSSSSFGIESLRQ